MSEELIPYYNRSRMCILHKLGAIALFLSVVLAATSSGPDPKNEDLYGDWDLVGIVDQGVVQDPKQVKGGTVKISKGKMLFKYADWDRALETEIEIRTDKEPKEIDEIIRSSVFRGIFDLKDDTLRIVFNGEEGGARPTNFEAEKDKRLVLYTLKRAKK